MFGTRKLNTFISEIEVKTKKEYLHPFVLSQSFAFFFTFSRDSLFVYPCFKALGK